MTGTPAGPPAAVLRMGTYNTLNGGRDPRRRKRRSFLRVGRRYSHHRWARQMDMLRELDLDVLCLQEAKHWGWYRLRATARALGMKGRLARSRSHGCHLVTLVRPPLVTFAQFAPDIAEGTFHHTVSRAELRVRGVDWTLRALHTHSDPFSPEDRAGEARWLTEYGGRDDTLLIGDLNSEAPSDPQPASWDWLPPHLHSRHRFQNPDGTYGDGDRRAMHALLRAGFQDPADLGFGRHRTAGYWDPTERYDHRSDYILPTRRMLETRATLLSYETVDTELARTLADHLLLVATIGLRRTPPALGTPRNASET
ncbi:endonuclease/exonuclease/phosphatase family protein [Streptomyces sp. NPDC056672]|uniref:endonuclease/exonuclease/phosphatase family protein n=1 Tax=Streptomyces sp. NPDC056672 TaxID=3345906 RepID=UPI003678CBE1